MAQCDYWMDDGDSQWCDLTNDPCNCGGEYEACSIKGKSIADALREEEDITLQEAIDKAKKRRTREAS